MEKERLDVFLFKNGHFVSRQKATDAIKKGLVTVNGVLPAKAGIWVSEEDNIEVTADVEFTYVSRSALKLKKALEIWSINPQNFVCVDIGSSTGGFVQVLLEQDAQKVYAIDTGSDQLHESLRDDSRVLLFEKTDIRNWTLPEPADLVTIDVSFISITKIMPAVAKLFSRKTVGVFLLKPQYEMEPYQKIEEVFGKDYAKLLEKIKTACNAEGLELVEYADSPITGKDGTKELLLFIRRVN